MYSIALSDYRYVSTCIVNENGPCIIDTIVDTGAKYTCYSAKDLGISIENVKDCEKKEYKVL